MLSLFVSRVAVGMEFQLFPQDFYGNSHINSQNPIGNHTETHKKSHRIPLNLLIHMILYSTNA